MRRTLEKNARNTIEREYSRDLVARKTVKAYESMMDSMDSTPVRPPPDSYPHFSHP